HLAKLDAFCDRYLDGAPGEHAAAVRVFNDALNRGRGSALAAAWPGFARAASGLASHRAAWAARLAAQRDLASGMTQYVADTL
ncbi:MAG: elongation factor P maturation arginine rhamnosyltransferase EarP, partial [Vicinamibacteria bacterium]